MKAIQKELGDKDERLAEAEEFRERVAKEAAGARVLLKQQAEVLSGEICEKILGRSL